MNSFEQEITHPLLTEQSEPQPFVTKVSGGSATGGSGAPLMFSIMDPTFQIKFERFHKTKDFISEMQLNYTKEKIASFAEEMGNYVFYFNVRIIENNISWDIRKRAQDVIELDDQLRHHLFRKKIKVKNLPILKLKDDKGDPNEIAEQIKLYLEDLLLLDQVRSLYIVYLFLEYSNTRLETTSAQKIKETYINKRAGGRFNENKWILKLGSCCLCWKKRYLIITSEGVLLKTDHMSTDEFRENLSFDHHYSLKYGLEQTGLERGLILHYSSRRLHIEAFDLFSFFDLLYSLILAFGASNYSNPPRYGSFAPVRENSTCEWYIDGQGYFESVYKHLKQAKTDVFITDWWLSPEMHLMRPVSKHKNEETRINTLLHSLAEHGVKVYIIVYREQTIALANDSYHTKKTLQSHKNIKVLRHPNRNFFLWSHHEKIVIIDQKYGFLGGLDLCYGRMDNKNHHLADPHYLEKKDEEFFPGIDYTNSRICDFFSVKEHAKARISKEAIPRMPWHDIAVKVEGDPVVDLCRHFIQYWNFAKYDLDPAKKGKDMLMTKGVNALEYDDDDRFDVYMNGIKERGGDDGTIEEKKEEEEEKEEEKEDKVAMLLKVNEKSKPDKRWIKAGTSVAALQPKNFDFRKLSSIYFYLLVNLFLGTAPSNHTLDQVETSKEFIQLIESLRKKQQDPEIMLLQPSIMPLLSRKIGEQTELIIDVNKSKDNPLLPELQHLDDEDDMLISTEFKPSFRQKLQNWRHSLLGSQSSMEEVAPKLQKYKKEDALKISTMNDEKIKGKRTEKAKCQILRSASNWSIGLKINNHEHSILNAYMGMILAAEHFIYIENQFFISSVRSTKGVYNPVINEIAKALYMRISKAAHEKKKFKVIVVMPLLPGFEGDVYSSSSALLKIQLHYEYHTISRGENSLIEMLKKAKIDPDKYISFYGLRNHTIMDEKPVTEIIYVHSKLIIVDDKYTLMGSANINDRSMLGDRDSEIAMLVEDQNMISSKMNECPYKAGEFSHSLRTTIFMEHFGLSFEEVKDPLSDTFLKTIAANAETNSLVYREVFGCYPDDTIETTDKSSNITVAEPSLEIYNILKKKIVGHAVEFPLRFLCNENLKFKMMAKERILPDNNFT